MDRFINALTAANCKPRPLGANGRYMASCPAHDDRKPSLIVTPGENGKVLVHCYAGCSTQEVLSALGLTMADLFADTGRRPTRPAPPTRPVASEVRKEGPPDLPVIDQKRASRLFDHALDNVLGGRADKELAERGISREWVEQNPLLGFVQSVNIAGWSSPLVNSWVIKVVDDDGRCIGLKAHRESPPPNVPKSTWLPFGTEPVGEPRHGCKVFWPSVAWIPVGERIYLIEGELKAAAMRSTGLYATSPTGGAGTNWTAWHVEQFRGRKTTNVYDDDPPDAKGRRAGWVFRDKVLEALKGEDVRAMTFGRR